MEVPAPRGCASLYRDVFHLLGDEQLIERGADFARHDLGERHDFRRGIAEVGEEDAARYVLGFERRRGEAVAA